MSASAFASLASWVAVIVSVGVVASVSAIVVSLPAAASVCNAFRFVATLAPLSETATETTCAVAPTAAAFAAVTPVTARLYALVMSARAFASLASWVAVIVSVGVVASVSWIVNAVPAAARACSALRFAVTFAAVSSATNA